MKKYLLLFVVLLNCLSLVAENDTIINPRYNVIQHSENLSSAMSLLRSVKNNKDSGFVVAHFGDSHIEGDFLSGVIRKNLQSIFRAGGEGILFPYSVCKGYGPKNLATTVAGEWTWATLVKNPEKYPIGVTGHTLVTKDQNAMITFVYNPKNEVQYGNGKVFEKVVIWHSANNFKLLLVKNGSADAIYYDTTKNANGLCCTIITNYRVGTELKFQFEGKSRDTIFNFHGIAFENPSQHGLEYNRCGTVGATFLQLVNQQEFTLAQLHKVNPNLIIFSYGSNESYDIYFSIDDYYKRVSAFIARIKTEFPGVSIIFTDTPDTRSRDRHPPNTVAINEKLNLIATENGAGFWDLNRIMGGHNSMFYWLANGLAGKDKLHFTKVGYELQANLFSLAFLNIYNDNSNKSIQAYCDSLQSKIDTQLAALKKPHSVFSGQTISVYSSEQVHYVKSGETLSGIAKQYGVTVQQLCAWNNLTANSVLHVNQKIVIRKK